MNYYNILYGRAVVLSKWALNDHRLMYMKIYTDVRRRTCLSPNKLITDRHKAVVLLHVLCQSVGAVSPYMYVC